MADTFFADELAAARVTPTIGVRPPPAGFGWNFTAHPVSVYRDGPRHFASDIDLRSKVTSDIWNGTVYFVSPSGSNANAGTSPGQAVRDIWKARQLLQASSALGGIILGSSEPIVASTLYDRNRDLNDTNGAGGAQNAKPTKPFALIGAGGRCIMGPIFAGLVWTADATTRTWSVTRGGVSSVNDISLLRDLGIVTRLPRIPADTAGADAVARLTNTRALVSAQPGTYALTQDNVLVVRLDRDVVPNDSTLAITAIAADAFNPGAVDAYLSGFTLLGGAMTGTLAAIDAATRNLVFEDVTIGSSGSDLGASRNAAVFDKMDGFVGMRRVSGLGSTNDIFNFHRTGASGKLHVLMIDCDGRDAGHDGASPPTQSNQIVTAHEDVCLISLNTQGHLSSGGVVRNINQSHHWDLGSEYSNDRGDTRFGGTQTSAAVVVNDTSKYWGDSITTRGCLESFVATSGAEIRLRDPIEIGGRRSGSGLTSGY